MRGPEGCPCRNPMSTGVAERARASDHGGKINSVKKRTAFCKPQTARTSASDHGPRSPGVAHDTTPNRPRSLHSTLLSPPFTGPPPPLPGTGSRLSRDSGRRHQSARPCIRPLPRPSPCKVLRPRGPQRRGRRPRSRRPPPPPTRAPSPSGGTSGRNGTCR